MSQIRDLLSRTLRRVTNRKSVALPAKVWATKGFEFWTFLSLLLLKSNCSRILELGTGRSSITLAEYAKFRNAHLTCVESSQEWFNKLRLDLRHLKLPTNVLQLIPVDRSTGWYDLERFRSATATGNFDFLFVDGPTEFLGSSSRGIRNSQNGVSELQACGRNAEVIIVDDVHRRHILDTLDRILVDPAQYDKWFYHYPPGEVSKATLCIMLRRGSNASRALAAIESLTGITLHPTFDPESCSED